MNRIWWVVGIILVAVALYICLAPHRQIPEGLELNDKLTHMLGHAALAAYFTGLVARRNWWKIFAFLLLFGIAVEFLQYYMNVGRHGDARDQLANSVGDLSGLLLGYLGLSRWPEWFARLRGGRDAT